MPTYHVDYKIQFPMGRWTSKQTKVVRASNESRARAVTRSDLGCKSLERNGGDCRILKVRGPGVPVGVPEEAYEEYPDVEVVSKEDFKSDTDSMLDRIGNILGGAFDWVKDRLGDFVDNVTGGLESLKDAIGKMIPDFIETGIPRWVSTIGENIGGAITSVFSKVKNGISKYMSTVFKGIQSLGEKIAGLIPDIDISLGSIANTISGTISGAISSVKSGISSLVSKVSGFVGDVTSAIESKLSSFGNTLGSFADGLVSSISEGISSFAGKIQSFGEATISTVESGIGKVASGIQNTIGAMTEALQGLGGMLFTALQNAIGWFIEQIRKLLEFTGKVAHRSVEELKGIE